jgi:hypothetical protein
MDGPHRALTGLKQGVNIIIRFLMLRFLIIQWAREDEDRKKMDAPQLSGSAASYATKRAWGNLLGIDDTKDSDATNKHGTEEKPVRPIPSLSKSTAWSYHVIEYANKGTHSAILSRFKALPKTGKIIALDDMLSNIDEVIPVPDYAKATEASLVSYAQLFLETIHGQEANKTREESIEKGVSVEDAIKVFKSKGQNPIVVNQTNLDREDSRKKKPKYIEVDDNFL